MASKGVEWFVLLHALALDAQPLASIGLLVGLTCASAAEQ